MNVEPGSFVLGAIVTLLIALVFLDALRVLRRRRRRPPAAALDRPEYLTTMLEAAETLGMMTLSRDSSGRITRAELADRTPPHKQDAAKPIVLEISAEPASSESEPAARPPSAGCRGRRRQMQRVPCSANRAPGAIAWAEAYPRPRKSPLPISTPL